MKCGNERTGNEKFEEVQQRLIENLPADDEIEDLASFYKLFSDYTRLRILITLGEEELCVGDIAKILGMEQSAISHQLRVLKQGRLVKNRRDGKVIYYQLDDDHIKEIMNSGLDHIKE